MTGPDTKYTGMIAEQSVKGYLASRKDGYCGHEHLPEFNLLNMNAHVATMLSHIIPVSVYNGQQEFANNMVMDKYGTYEQGSRFSEGKEYLFFIDYIFYGQLFIEDKNVSYPLYKLPIYDCLPLLLNLMRVVF